MHVPHFADSQKLDSHMNTGRMVRDDPLDALQGARVSTSVANVMRTSAMRESQGKIMGKDKSDRATVEQAIDPRTRMVRTPGAGKWAGGAQCPGRGPGRGHTQPRALAGSRFGASWWPLNFGSWGGGEAGSLCTPRPALGARSATWRTFRRCPTPGAATLPTPRRPSTTRCIFDRPRAPAAAAARAAPPRRFCSRC